MSNFLKHLLVQHLLLSYSIQHDILPHPALVCTVYTLFSFSRLSHKLYIHHTWYMESTAHVQLLPNTVKTHKPTRRTPLLSEDQVGPLSRRDDPPPPAFSLLPPLHQFSWTILPQNLEYLDIMPAFTSQLWITLLPISLCKNKSNMTCKNVLMIFQCFPVLLR